MIIKRIQACLPTIGQGWRPKLGRPHSSHEDAFSSDQQLSLCDSSLPVILERVFSIVAKGAVILVVLAVAIGRSGRPSAVDPDRLQRTYSPPPIVVTADVPVDLPSTPKTEQRRNAILFDPRTTRRLPSLPASADSLSQVSFSPWHDAKGRSQLVGASSGRLFAQSDGPSLVNISVPDGALLGSVPLRTGHVGHPCWFPDGSSRVLFVDGRGRLQRVDFDDLTHSPAPAEVTWRDGATVCEGVFTGDLSWPAALRPASRILATVASYKRDANGRSLREWNLYWLELNEDQTEIIDSGPLLPAVANATDEVVKRFPVLCTTPSGNTTLAYLERSNRDLSHRWHLCLTTLGTNPVTGDPVASEERVRSLADNCVAIPPVFSSDGRWLYYVPWPKASHQWEIERVSTVAATPEAYH